MENEYYMALNDFIAVSGLTTGEFAEKANIYEEILKECITTKSKPIIGNFISTALGCRKVIDEQPDESRKAALQNGYTRLFEEYLTAWPKDFQSIPNPHFIRRIESMAELAGKNIHMRVQELLHPGEEKPAVHAAAPTPAAPVEEGNLSDKLQALLARLNETGQQELLKRAEELTYVPAYQNKN
jgi:hypothetical protein